MAQPIPAIKKRQPTGIVPPPFILIEGEEKSGKSFVLAKLTKSPRVGECYWLDLNEGAADEYGPIGNYTVIDHDGTWRDIYDQTRAVHARAAEVAAEDGKPVVLGIDSGTAEWDMLKDWIGARAEKSNANKKLLAEDPNAEIRIPNNLWNEANAKHRKLMRLLMTFQGIVVMTARGKEVAVIGKDGKPVAGEKRWKPETQQAVPYDVTAWINMRREEGATLIGARSLHIGVQPGKDKPLRMPDQWYDAEHGGLDWFIFDAMKYDPHAATTRQITELNTTDVDDGEPTAASLLDMTRNSWTSLNGLSIVLDLAEEYDLMDAEVEGPGGRPYTLGSLVNNQIQALQRAQQEQQPQPQTRAPEQENARGPQGERAQGAQQERAPESTETRAPAEQDAQPDERQGAQQESRPPENARATQAAEQPNQTQLNRLRCAQEEVSFQAEHRGEALVPYLAPVLGQEGNLGTFNASDPETVQWIIAQRAETQKALRAQGMATLAEAYERIGDAFPMSLDFVQEKARELEGAHS